MPYRILFDLDINNIYETGEWPNDFIVVTMIALKKEPKTATFFDNNTVGLIEYVAKIVARVLRRRIEKKIEDILGEGQIGFRRGKGNRLQLGR
jgi:hypothetical protein